MTPCRGITPIETERLLLRRWQPSDREPFAALNADPRVMEHFPARLSRAESDAFADRIEHHFEQYGFGLWAVERRNLESEARHFIGYIGLQTVRFEADFTPAIEIGWRLAFDAWGQGLATEGATAVLAAARDRYGLDRIVSFAAETNRRSWRLMERLGMRYVGQFEHPQLPAEHRLQPHCFYEIELS